MSKVDLDRSYGKVDIKFDSILDSSSIYLLLELVLSFSKIKIIMKDQAPI